MNKMILTVLLFCAALVLQPIDGRAQENVPQYKLENDGADRDDLRDLRQQRRETLRDVREDRRKIQEALRGQRRASDRYHEQRKRALERAQSNNPRRLENN